MLLFRFAAVAAHRGALASLTEREIHLLGMMADRSDSGSEPREHRSIGSDGLLGRGIS